MTMESVIGTVLLCLVLSFFFSQIFRKMHLPAIMGPIFAGLVIGLPVIKSLVIDENAEIMISSFSEIGLVFLMFYVGLTIEFSGFKDIKKPTLSIALVSFILTFLLGFLAGKFIFGLTTTVSLMLTLGISVMSESVSASIFEKYKILGTKTSNIVMGAGVINDVIGVVLIGLLVTGLKAGQFGGMEIFFMAFYLSIFIILVYVTKFLVIPILIRIAEDEKSEIQLFINCVMVALLLSSVALALGLDAILGALLAGMLINYFLVHHAKKHIEVKQVKELVAVFTFGFFALFFFLDVGMNANFSVMISHTALTLTFIFIASFGSIFGSYLGGIMSGLKSKTSVIIGVGLNSRDAIGLIIANIAYQNALIPDFIYYALVFVAFTTTIITPMILDFMVKKNLKDIKKNII